MNRKVLLLSASFDRAKGTGAELAAAATRGALLDDPNAPSGAEQRAARWKVRSAYGDIGLQYREDETVAYVASRMPAIYAACHRVLREVRELPELDIVRYSVSRFYLMEHIHGPICVLCRFDGGCQSLRLPRCWILVPGQAQRFGKHVMITSVSTEYLFT